MPLQGRTASAAIQFERFEAVEIRLQRLRTLMKPRTVLVRHREGEKAAARAGVTSLLACGKRDCRVAPLMILERSEVALGAKVVAVAAQAGTSAATGAETDRMRAVDSEHRPAAARTRVDASRHAAVCFSATRATSSIVRGWKGASYAHPSSYQYARFHLIMCDPKWRRLNGYPPRVPRRARRRDARPGNSQRILSSGTEDSSMPRSPPRDLVGRKNNAACRSARRLCRGRARLYGGRRRGPLVCADTRARSSGKENPLCRPHENDVPHVVREQRSDFWPEV